MLDVSPTARAGDAQRGAPRVPLLTMIAFGREAHLRICVARALKPCATTPLRLRARHTALCICSKWHFTLTAASPARGAVGSIARPGVAAKSEEKTRVADTCQGPRQGLDPGVRSAPPVPRDMPSSVISVNRCTSPPSTSGSTYMCYTRNMNRVSAPGKRIHSSVRGLPLSAY